MFCVWSPEYENVVFLLTGLMDYCIKLHVYKGRIKFPSGRAEVLILGDTGFSSF